jgi:Rrf2 family protein
MYRVFHWAFVRPRPLVRSADPRAGADAAAARRLQRNARGWVCVELSRVTDYGVRAVMYLSVAKGLSRTQDVSEAMHVPKAYLSKVLQELGRRDIVRLKPGVKGGVCLVPNPADLTLLEVVEAMEGHLAFTRCSYAPGECAFETHCPVHDFWMDLQKLVTERLSSITFDEFARHCNIAVPDQGRKMQDQEGTVFAALGEPTGGQS